MNVQGVEFDIARLSALCDRHAIARLSLFGSILTDRFRPDSDVDILAQFYPGRTPGMIRFAQIAIEIEQIIGRTVDLRTPADLSPHFRDEVVRGARLLHAA